VGTHSSVARTVYTHDDCKYVRRWLQLRFDRCSTPIGLQFDRATTILRYGLEVPGCGLNKEISRSAWLYLAGYVKITLMTSNEEHWEDEVLTPENM